MIYPLLAPPSVSSSFGTYRINHHHSGIDLYAYEGTPVVAAADGVVSLIKRGSGGYGRAVYLRHKNGYTTLYAHLATFAPSIQRLVDQRAGVRAQFKLKIRPREKITFKAGEIIGWSGTSGTDLCHLHFELRYKNAPLNPLTHGLELPDQVPPTLIAIYADPLDERARVEGGMIPQRYQLAPRPRPHGLLATALSTPQPKSSSAERDETSSEIASSAHVRRRDSRLKANAEPKSKQSAETHTPTEIAQSPTITAWGNVGLSLEVEDRIDGSQRELTPYQIELYIGDRLVHQLRYNQTSYADKRSSSLDFDVGRRQGDRLIHRLYRYGPKLRVLKRGSVAPLKRLKRGQHEARVVAIDAAGNRSVAKFKLRIEPPPPPPCRLKRKRLPRRSKARALWRPQDPSAPQLSWRPYGLSFNLPEPCASERPLEIDLRINGRRVSSRFFSLSGSPQHTTLNLHLDRVKSSQWRREVASDSKSKTKIKPKKRSKTPKNNDKSESNYEMFKLEDDVDHSIDLLIGLRGLASPKEGAQAAETADSPQSITRAKSLPTSWYKLRVHHVTSGAYFQGDGVQVRVGKDAPFKPYITSAVRIPHIKPRSPASDPLTSQTHKPQPTSRAGLVGQEIVFASPWTPMQSANEVLIELSRRERRKRHTGSYLLDGDRQWWVSLKWLKQGLSASSTHLAHFAVLQDLDPPEVGVPLWDLKPPLGPRLIIPISDNLSGVSQIKLFWDRKEVPIEVQRSWGRMIYKPMSLLKPQRYAYEVYLKDRSGRETTQKGELSWPPKPERQLKPQDPSRLYLTPQGT